MRKRLKNIHCSLKSKRGKLAISRWKTREGKPYVGPDIVMSNMDAVEAYWVGQTRKEELCEPGKANPSQ
jgi:hypothetical protein